MCRICPSDSINQKDCVSFSTLAENNPETLSTIQNIFKTCFTIIFTFAKSTHPTADMLELGFQCYCYFTTYTIERDLTVADMLELREPADMLELAKDVFFTTHFTITMRVLTAADMLEQQVSSDMMEMT